MEEFPNDSHLRAIVISYLSLLMELAARFYERQFEGYDVVGEEFVHKVDSVLERYYAEGKHLESGIPSVRYCAGELFISPNYFGDLMRVRTGESATQYIRHFLMDKARVMLEDGYRVSEVSETLGFEYPQHFTRMFKKEYGVAPSKMVKDHA